MYPIRTNLLSNRRAKLILWYNCDWDMIFAADDIEVGEKQKYEIIIRSNQTGPGGDVLNKL